MEISKEAKARLDNRVSRIVRDIDVYDTEKKEIVRELTSHFYDASMSRARARGSSVIDNADVEAVFADSEDPREIAAGYMKNYVDSLKRAGIVVRTGAFIVDVLLMSIIATAIILITVLPLLPVLSGSFNTSAPGSGNAFTFTNHFGETIFTMLVIFESLAVDLVYFIVLEGRFGYSPGKWVFRLRVLKEDGTRISYVDSLLRNLPKLLDSFTLLAIDALIMVILFRKDRQRGFDKIARTIVVHKSRKTEEARLPSGKEVR